MRNNVQKPSARSRWGGGKKGGKEGMKGGRERERMFVCVCVVFSLPMWERFQQTHYNRGKHRNSSRITMLSFQEVNKKLGHWETHKQSLEQ